jgi:hypothetical protein
MSSKKRIKLKSIHAVKITIKKKLNDEKSILT